MENPEFTLAEYFRIIRKRKWTLGGVFIIVMLSTAIFTKLQTPIYEASLELKIEKQQTAMGELTGGGGSSGKTSPFATEIRLISSLPIMQKVVERMEVLPADPEAREQAIHALSLSYQSRVAIDQIGDTNIVNVRVQSSDPQDAALMATAIADVYIMENVGARKKQTIAQINYIENQLETSKTQLKELETKLQKFKQNEKVLK